MIIFFNHCFVLDYNSRCVFVTYCDAQTVICEFDVYLNETNYTFHDWESRREEASQAFRVVILLVS